MTSYTPSAMPTKQKFKVGLVQMAMSARPAGKPREGGREGARGGEARAPRSSACRSCSARSTSARTRTHALFDLAEPIPGPTTEALGRVGEGRRGGDRRLRLRAPRAGALPQHRRRSSTPTGPLAGLYRKMHIPDDPLYYEKFYFTPGDLGFQAFDTRLRPHRRAHLLGPVVSRGRAAHRAAGRRHPLLPDRHRLAPAREGRARRRPARRLADHPARPRDRQRRLRRGGEPRRPREARADGGDGLEFWGNVLPVPTPSASSSPRRSTDREEILVGDVRPAAHRGGPPQLALPPRPPHRRLRGDRPALPRPRVDGGARAHGGAFVPGGAGMRASPAGRPSRQTAVSARLAGMPPAHRTRHGT